MASLHNDRQSRTREILGQEEEHIERAKQDVATKGSWHSMAFQLESIILVAFLVVSIAIMTVLFASSYKTGSEANAMSESLALAVTSAENSAETFSADPINAKSYSTYYRFDDGTFVKVDEDGEGVYTVSRIVTPEKRDAGTLYRATVIVERNGEEVYHLNTAKYVSDGR